MKQYKIPQKFGIQDKIVGPFTLKQLIIVGVGGGISYLIFIVGSRVYQLNVLEYFFIALPFLLSLAFALVKINNVTFFRFILLTLEFSIKPKKRHWDHRSIVSITDPNLVDTAADKKKNQKEADVQGKERKNVNLDDLTKILDSGGFEHVKEVEHKDLDSAKDDNLVAQAFFGHKRGQSKTQNMYWRTIDSQKDRLEIMSKFPSAKKEEKKPAETQQVVGQTASAQMSVKGSAGAAGGSSDDGGGSASGVVATQSQAINASGGSTMAQSSTSQSDESKTQPSVDKTLTLTLEKKSSEGGHQAPVDPSKKIDESDLEKKQEADSSHLSKDADAGDSELLEQHVTEDHSAKDKGESILLPNEQGSYDQKTDSKTSTEQATTLDQSASETGSEKTSPSSFSMNAEGEVDVEKLKKGETIELNLD